MFDRLRGYLNDFLELRQTRTRNALAEARVRQKQLDLAESTRTGISYAYGDFVSFRDDLWDEDGWGGSLLSHQRQHGENAPFVRSESELTEMRSLARWLCEVNPFAIGALENLTSFVVGEGLTYRATVKDKSGKPLADAVQAVVDEFLDLNEWSELEQELFRRSRRDGEYFLRLFPDDEGLTHIRTAEPDEITEQNAPIGDHPPGAYSFGIRHLIETDDETGVRHEDVQTVLGYWLKRGPEDQGHEVEPSYLLHTKVNVDRQVKRGMSDFYATRELLEGTRKLLKNMREGEAVRAAIAGFWQYENTSSTAASTHIGTVKDTGRATAQNQVTGKTPNYQKIDPGTFIHTPKNKVFVPPPSSPATSSQVEVVQAVLRAVGARWCMPEYMVSADSSNANYACHDSETQVLTKRGWLKYDQICYGDEIGTMNPDTCRFEWQEVQAIHVHDYDGEMIRLSGSHNLDVLVTPNHRMYVTTEQFRRSVGSGGKLVCDGIKPWRFVRADEIRPGMILPFSCVPKDGVPIETFEVPAVRHDRYYVSEESHPQPRMFPMGGFLRYLGWWISEGWVLSKGYPYTIGVSQTTLQAAECTDIRQATGVMRAAGVNIREYAQANGLTAWQATDKSLWTWLRANCGTGSYTKRLPVFVNNLPACQQEEILGSLLLGDGHHRVSGSASYFTVSDRLADDVQALAIQCGYVSHVCKRMANGVLPVSVRLPKRTLRVYDHHISRVPYRGVVWCVTVPNGLVVTRRNGKSIVTGNSTLVSGAPAVRFFKRLQRFYKQAFLKSIWAAVRFAFAAGRFDALGISYAQLEKLVTIQAEAPKPEIITEFEDAQRRQIERLNGVLSVQTWQQETGRDPEQEMANNKAFLEETGGTSLVTPPPTDQPGPEFEIPKDGGDPVAIAPSKPLEQPTEEKPPPGAPAQEGRAVSESYFDSCPRDSAGHCKPKDSGDESGSGGGAPSGSSPVARSDKEKFLIQSGFKQAALDKMSDKNVHDNWLVRQPAKPAQPPATPLGTGATPAAGLEPLPRTPRDTVDALNLIQSARYPSQGAEGTLIKVGELYDAMGAHTPTQRQQIQDAIHKERLAKNVTAFQSDRGDSKEYTALHLEPKAIREPEPTRATPQQLRDLRAKMLQTMDDKLAGSVQMTPIHELRDAVPAPDRQAFDATLLSLRREKVVRLVSLSDRSQATHDQWRKSIGGVGELFFFVEPGEKWRKAREARESACGPGCPCDACRELAECGGKGGKPGPCPKPGGDAPKGVDKAQSKGDDWGKRLKDLRDKEMLQGGHALNSDERKEYAELKDKEKQVKSEAVKAHAEMDGFKELPGANRAKVRIGDRSQEFPAGKDEVWMHVKAGTKTTGNPSGKRYSADGGKTWQSTPSGAAAVSKAEPVRVSNGASKSGEMTRDEYARDQYRLTQDLPSNEPWKPKRTFDQVVSDLKAAGGGDKDIRDFTDLYAAGYDAYLTRLRGKKESVDREVLVDEAADGTSSLLDVPDESQDSGWSCGAAVCTALARFYGVEPNTEAEAVLALGSSPRDGTDPEHLIQVLQNAGLETTAISGMTLEDVEWHLGKGRPVIVAYQAWGTPKEVERLESGHYAIVYGVDTEDVLIMDPARFTPDEVQPEYGGRSLGGQKVAVPRAEFVRRWIDADGENKIYRQYGISVRSPSQGPLTESYFDTCPRDAKGHCKPKDSGDESGTGGGEKGKASDKKGDAEKSSTASVSKAKGDAKDTHVKSEKADPKPSEEKSKDGPALNPEEDYAKNGTKAKAFKDWFGDWEKDPANASKVVGKDGTPAEQHLLGKGSAVVDAEGKPMVVYHGTRAQFTAFDKAKQGSNLDPGDWGAGFYFGSKETAEHYGRVSGPLAEPGGHVKPVYLSIKKPFTITGDRSHDELSLDHPATPKLKAMFGDKVIDDAIASGDDIPTLVKHTIGSKQFTATLQKHGYDGFHRKFSDKTFEWVAFEPNQIKSVQNKGTFNPKSNELHESASTQEQPHE